MCHLTKVEVKYEYARLNPGFRNLLVMAMDGVYDQNYLYFVFKIPNKRHMGP